MCDFMDCEKWKELDCSQYNAQIFKKPTCYRPLTENQAPRADVPLDRGVSCPACEPLGDDMEVTGITTRPGKGIIGITIKQKWNNKYILLEKVCEQGGN